MENLVAQSDRASIVVSPSSIKPHDLRNVAFVIDARLEATERSTGMNLANVFWIESDGQGKGYDQQSTVKFDLEFNLLPGVASASVNSGLPQTRDGLRSLISPDPDLKTNKRFAFVYQTNERIVDVLGLHLVAGRIFSPETVLPRTTRVNTGRSAVRL